VLGFIQGVDDIMRRRQALADALLSQGPAMAYGGNPNVGVMTTPVPPVGVPGNPPLATGVPRSLVKPGMPQPAGA
jgi:hypothetical protein